MFTRESQKSISRRESRISRRASRFSLSSSQNETKEKTGKTGPLMRMMLKRVVGGAQAQQGSAKSAFGVDLSKLRNLGQDPGASFMRRGLMNQHEEEELDDSFKVLGQEDLEELESYVEDMLEKQGVFEELLKCAQESQDGSKDATEDRLAVDCYRHAMDELAPDLMEQLIKEIQSRMHEEVSGLTSQAQIAPDRDNAKIWYH